MESLINSISLGNFKNIEDADLNLGKFSLLIGTNASGKSNVREGFRFLHGVARGYSLAEIIGEKWIEGGIPVWRGIRGGISEIARSGKDEFTLSTSVSTPSGTYVYFITISILPGKKTPILLHEDLLDISTAIREDSDKEDGIDWFSKSRYWVYSTILANKQSQAQPSSNIITAKIRTDRRRGRYPTLTFPNNRPILSQIAASSEVPGYVRNISQSVLAALASMRFFDLQPESMRRPSIPGQTVLGDQGENLSSVLLAICEDPDQKEALIEWVRELTPMDVVDFEFPSDQTGRVLVSLVESGGHTTSAYSASDGTLRFLGIIAALLGPEPARFYFFEELENGIHPSRLHLLLQLIEQTVEKGEIQVVATTHSPQLLGLVSQKTLESSSLIYRLPDATGAQIKPLLEIPEVRRVLETQDIARLHASGWFEDIVDFTAEEETDS